MRQIYNFLLYLILPLLPLRLWWRSRKNSAYRKRIPERFAYFDFPALSGCIWVHAVSLGEAIAALPLIRALIQYYPDTKIVVTTMTPTGAERIQQTFRKDEVLQLYVPYDYPFVVKRFLHYTKPKILILMETELWPNILYYTAQAKIPIVLASARLSDQSFAGYRKIRALIKPLLNCISTVLAQSKLDAERFLALGIEPQKISVAGNIKFDLIIPDEVLVKAKQLRIELGDRPIWIAASTHKMEEEKVLLAFRKVLAMMPKLLLILVPRHPERFDEVFELCNQEKFNVVRYSNLESYSAGTHIILGDVMGQLLLFYAVSDITFVGGSLILWGGHNLLEPAALAKPIISGPNLGAFLEVSQMLTEADALIKVADEKALAEVLLKLLGDQAMREKIGTAALDVVEKHRGVINKILATISRAMK